MNCLFYPCVVSYSKSDVVVELELRSAQTPRGISRGMFHDAAVQDNRGLHQNENLMMMDHNMIDAASGGALMDKTPVVARHLISNMASNTQQFRT
ncbi:hypothetical protein CR513_23405, partial [Mucuna pruriens]